MQLSLRLCSRRLYSWSSACLTRLKLSLSVPNVPALMNTTLLLSQIA
jgi:hypothetical protein